MGAFSKKRRKDESFWCHIPSVFVEDKQEGNNGVGSPSKDKAQAYAEKHLLNTKKTSLTTTTTKLMCNEKHLLGHFRAQYYGCNSGERFATS